MYKLVAVDLDGTLLNSKKRISDKNKETIRKAIDAGFHVLVCSGRIYTGARVFGEEIGTNLPIITCNGARIMNMKTDEEIYSITLPLDICEKIVDFCHNFNIYVHAYIGDILFTERLDFSSLRFSERNKELPENRRIDIRVIDNLINCFRQNPDKISKLVIMSYDSNKLAEAREELEKVKGIAIMSSGSDNFEIMDETVSKGDALKFMAEKYGIKQEEVIAIGDNENDLSMLEYAGLAVAMGNGEDYVKDIADFVTLSNDDNGVAYAINKFMLKN